MKHLRNLLISVLALIIALSAFGCQSKYYKRMVDDLKENGTYSAEYEKYEIYLGYSVDYYYYTDSDNIWLSYFSYSSGSSVSFYICFDEELSGEYSWTLYSSGYTYKGDLTASEFNDNTTYLYYNSSESTDSYNESINSAARKLAASACKLCLTSLELHFMKNDVNVELSDLGFDM